MWAQPMDDCSICLSALAPGSAILTLSCNHKFHFQCLASSIQAQNKECPLCRATIDAPIAQLLVRPQPPPMLPPPRMLQPTQPFNFWPTPHVSEVNVSHFCIKNPFEQHRTIHL
jgi:hypothetical protein